MNSETYFNWTVTAVILVLLLYQLLKKRYRYWADKGVPYLEPNLIFGNSKNTILYNEPFIDHHLALYRKSAPHPYAGYFIFQRPVLLIRDPELAKCVLTKDSSYFPDRNEEFARNHDILSQHLFNLGGQKWRNLRVKLTSTFSSGKMKGMFHLMKECSENLVRTIEDELLLTTDSSEKVIHLDMKELFARYSTDVIVSCAFGLDSKTLRANESEVDFRLIGKKIFQNSLRRRLFGIMNGISPKLINAFKFKFNDAGMEQFFVKLVSDTVTYRETNHVERNDFLNLLMELKKKDETEIRANDESEDDMKMTVELMAAQCFIFFVAGFDTSSGVLSHCLLELSKHPHYQQKLRDEVNRTLEQTDGQITYETLKRMPYMQQVINETMRMYPSLPTLFRQCSKPYRIPNTDVVIEEGTKIIVPVYGIHCDDNYYPNANVFDPENFSEERKASRHPFTFLPFGEGPRICIGLRFGEMQVKLALTMLIQRYKFSLSPKMKFPTKFSSHHVLTSIAGGVWLQVNKC